MQLPVEVAVTQRLMESFPASFVEVLGIHQQQLADPVERITFPPAVRQRGPLDALPALRDRRVGETNDMERIDHDRHASERTEARDRRAVALERIDRHHPVAPTVDQKAGTKYQPASLVRPGPNS